MTCRYETTEMWTPNFTVPGEDKQYMVQLSRDIGCCGDEQNELFINGVRIVDHGYVHNRYSPLCGHGGEYEWQRDGHTFLLMFNSLACSRYKDHRLFVDGVDVKTGREFSAFWKRYGYIYFTFGLVLFLIGVVCLVCFFAIDISFPLDAKFRIALPLVVVGLVYVAVGLIPIHKFRRPRYHPDQMQHGQTTWPSGYGNSLNV